jgi:hypothetical protein
MRALGSRRNRIQGAGLIESVADTAVLDTARACPVEPVSVRRTRSVKLEASCKLRARAVLETSVVGAEAVISAPEASGKVGMPATDPTGVLARMPDHATCRACRRSQSAAALTAAICWWSPPVASGW